MGRRRRRVMAKRLARRPSLIRAVLGQSITLIVFVFTLLATAAVILAVAPN